MRSPSAVPIMRLAAAVPRIELPQRTSFAAGPPGVPPPGVGGVPPPGVPPPGVPPPGVSPCAGGPAGPSSGTSSAWTSFCGVSKDTSTRPFSATASRCAAVSDSVMCVTPLPSATSSRPATTRPLMSGDQGGVSPSATEQADRP